MAAEEHPFDVATEADKRVNRMLAESGGKICEMSYDGAIGYHINVAAGESDPEYLWKIAFLQALDESVLEMAHIDGETPGDCRLQLERQLGGKLDPMTLDYLADIFEEKLNALVEAQEGRGPGGGEE